MTHSYCPTASRSFPFPYHSPLGYDLGMDDRESPSPTRLLYELVSPSIFGAVALVAYILVTEKGDVTASVLGLIR